MAEGGVIARDESGRFASSNPVVPDKGSTEVLRLDDPRVSMATYKSAREAGEDFVRPEDAEEAPKITGEESMREFKDKRDHTSKGGYQKRLDRLVKQREEARAEAAQLREKYEAPGALESRVFADVAQRKAANSSGAAPQDQSRESLPEERTSEGRQAAPPEDRTTKALRQEYEDWDEVFTRAQKEKFRISDDAAKVLHSLPENVRSHVSYLLAKNDDFRNELNKLPPGQQAQEIEVMGRNMEGIRHPEAREFKQKLQTALSKEERAEIMRAGKANPLGTRIVTSTVRELNALPNGVEVSKYLLSHPEVCEQFKTMNQERAHLELGRISARLERNGPREFVSHAPPPIKPVGNSSTVSSVPMDSMDMGSYKAARAAGRVR